MPRAALARAAGPGWQAAVELMLYAVTLLCVQAGLLAPGHYLAGDIANAGLLVLLVNAGPDPETCATATEAAAVAAMRALAVVALIAIIGLGLPLHDGSDAAGTLVVAMLVGAAAIWIAPGVGLPRASLLRARLSTLHLWPAAAGLALGLVAYLLGASPVWSAGASGARVLVALVAAVVAAAVEEGVFRGLVQITMQRAAGRVGFVGSVVLFSATYLGTGSAALVLTFALAGLIFADNVARTGSLVGAGLGHVVLVLAAGALWPAVLGRRHHASLSDLGTTIVLSLAIAVVAALSLRRQLPADNVSAATGGG
jgi:hypothetical protein